MHIHSIPQLNISKNYIISQQTNNISNPHTIKFDITAPENCK